MKITIKSLIPSRADDFFIFIAAALLKRALEDLASSGIKRVEVYPVIDNDAEEHNYHGPLSLYQKQGFTVVRKTKDHAVVEKILA